MLASKLNRDRFFQPGSATDPLIILQIVFVADIRMTAWEGVFVLFCFFQKAAAVELIKSPTSIRL